MKGPQRQACHPACHPVSLCALHLALSVPVLMKNLFPVHDFFLLFLKGVILLSARPYLSAEQAEQVFTAAVCHSHQANSTADTLYRVVDPTTTPDRNFCLTIPMSRHASTLSFSRGSRILALHAMSRRLHGSQRGVAEENRGRSP